MAVGKKPHKRSGEQISGRSSEYQTIGAWLRRCREQAGLGQREVNRALEKSNTYLYRVETGQQRIDLLQFLELAQVLGLDQQLSLKDLWQIAGIRIKAERKRSAR